MQAQVKEAHSTLARMHTLQLNSEDKYKVAQAAMLAKEKFCEK